MAQRPATPELREPNVETGLVFVKNSIHFDSLEDAYSKLRELFPRVKECEVYIGYIKVYNASFHELGVSPEETEKRRSNFIHAMTKLSSYRNTLGMEDQLYFDSTMDYIKKQVWLNMFGSMFGGKRSRKAPTARKTRSKKLRNTRKYKKST